MSDKILVLTRDFNSNQDILSKISDLSFQIINFPTLSFSTNIAHKQEEVLNNITKYDWIIFTSVNGVKHFKEIFKEDLESKVTCIGEVTDKAVKKYFNVKSDFIPTKANSVDFSKELIKVLEDKQVLLISGDKSSNVISQELEKNKIQVDNLVVYKNHLFDPTEELISKIKKIETKNLCFIFYSPSAFENTLKNLGKDLLSNSTLISIGPTTSKRIEEEKLVVSYESKEQTFKGIREILIKLETA